MQHHVQGQYAGQQSAQHSPRQLLESARRAEADGNVDLAVHVSRYVLEHFAGSPESAEAYNNLLRLGQAPQGNGAPTHAAPMQPTNHAAAPVMVNGYASHGATMQAAQARFNGHVPAAAQPAATAWQPAPQAAIPPPAAFNAGHGNGYANAPANGHAAYAAAAAPVARASAAPMSAPAHAGAHLAQPHSAVQAIAATFAPAAPYRGAEANPPAMIHHAPEITPQYRGGRIVARFTYAAGGLMMVAGVLSPLPAVFGLLGLAPSLLGTALVAGALIAVGLLALLGSQTALAVFDQADNMRELVELERTRWNG